MAQETLVDLRSDTVTRPSAAMYEAMRAAAVGDDVYGEDPTVNRLEAEAARLLGKEAGLFLSSATQANLVAMLVHNARGEEVLLGDQYHIFVSEAGGSSALGGVVLYPLATDAAGGLSPQQVLAAIKDDDPHHPVTRTLALENTVSGQVQEPSRQQALAATAREHGLCLHLDGARLMNAAVALGAAAVELAAPFDSVMLCLSKGLGGPVGALLCGDSRFIARARRQRKQLGGGMRQAGVLAACGLYALENNVERLAEDHARAAWLAEGLGEIDDLPVRHATNMVFVEPRAQDIAPLTRHLRDRGVEIGNQAPRLRLVTHLDIDDNGIERALDAFRSYYG
jgi:threonine aldolase